VNVDDDQIMIKGIDLETNLVSKSIIDENWIEVISSYA
jgi:hypothetical protein